jgi:hypothetical protein
MKHALIGSVAVTALLSVVAKAMPLPDPANSIEAVEPAALQKIDWYDGEWR